MPAPLNKTEFYRRYARGEFGNRFHQWDTWEELRDSGFHGDVSGRSFRVTDGMLYKQDVDDLRSGIIPEGVKLGELRFIETPPDDKLTIQGHVWLHEDGTGLNLEYSTVPGIPNRVAMHHPKQERGIAAVHLLKRHFDPSSYDDLQDFLERFPEAVVEFTCYQVPVGVLRRKVIFWEVRNY